jgi:hypothetical protein
MKMNKVRDTTSKGKLQKTNISKIETTSKGKC